MDTDSTHIWATCIVCLTDRSTVFLIIGMKLTDIGVVTNVCKQEDPPQWISHSQSSLFMLCVRAWVTVKCCCCLPPSQSSNFIYFFLLVLPLKTTFLATTRSLVPVHTALSRFCPNELCQPRFLGLSSSLDTIIASGSSTVFYLGIQFVHLKALHHHCTLQCHISVHFMLSCLLNSFKLAKIGTEFVWLE